MKNNFEVTFIILQREVFHNLKITCSLFTMDSTRPMQFFFR